MGSDLSQHYEDWSGKAGGRIEEVDAGRLENHESYFESFLARRNGGKLRRDPLNEAEDHIAEKSGKRKTDVEEEMV